MRDVHYGGTDIHHNLVTNGRRVEMERHDGSRLYYERGRPGYISRSYRYGDHDYARRTFYYNGRPYDRFYNHYQYRNGVYFDVYAPARYYSPGFYQWAYSPWINPVQYQWGFATAAWYGYYPGYFTPYAVYASSQLWLTDYLIAQSLQASYAAALAANAQQAQMAGMAPLTPETKQMIADEVALQVSYEYQAAKDAKQQADAASGSIGPMLADGKPHVFVAGKEVDVVDASTNQECAVTDGDVLRLMPPVDPNGTTANLMVISSKGGVECHNRQTVTVALTDLQEMQNHLRETVDLGLQELQAKQGTGGLPRATVSALAPPTTTQMAQNAPPPETDAKDIEAQAQQADQAEKEAVAGAPGGPSDTPAASLAVAPPVAPVVPVVVDLNHMTLEQMVAALGPYKNKFPLGPNGSNGDKYVFNDVTVTIKGGKVVKIE